MGQFILLLYDNPGDFADYGPEEMQKVVEEYRAWADKLAKEGRLLGSLKLKDEGGRTLKIEGERIRMTDGPYSETKEVLGGYFVIDAPNYDQAAEIGRSCPHVKYGTRIDVREIEIMRRG